MFLKILVVLKVAIALHFLFCKNEETKQQILDFLFFLDLYINIISLLIC